MIVSTDHRNILQELNYNAIASNRLLMVQIDITDVCNCHCFFCFQGNDHQDKESVLSYEKIVSLLDELRDLGCYHLSFSGGEPFCRKDFMQILYEAKKRGFLITFVSNLQLPTPEQINQLTQLGIAKILVSFHSHKPDTYSKIFQVNEEFYWKALNNIKMLVKSETPLGITTTVSDYNATELDNIVQLFTSIGLNKSDIRFNLLLEGNNHITNHRGGIQLNTYLREHKDLKTNILSKLRIGGRSFICPAGKASCVIKSNGNVVPCGFMNSIAGNVNNSSLKNIWETSHVFKFIRSIDENHFKKCIGCSNLTTCPVCMATNLNETGNYHEPSESYCEFRKCISNSLE